MSNDRELARRIWQTAVDAVDPRRLVAETMADIPTDAERIIVVGAGKAGARMAEGLEDALADRLNRVVGIVNVPDEEVRPLQKIRLHAARPARSNLPTEAGVRGSEEMLTLLNSARPDDVAICLISGGGSALMPAPVDGVPLADKLAVTKELHAAGATIGEMNCVRKHLSRVKGGGLAAAFRGKNLHSLILSDVVGDPLDVIASGPTAPDPTTSADAVEVLRRHRLWDAAPASVRRYLETAAPNTGHRTPNTRNQIVGSNATALTAAESFARSRGWNVLNLGSFIEGEAREVAAVFAGLIRSIRRDARPVAPPVCVLAGGETTVRLCADPGRGGRNQELALSVLLRLGAGSFDRFTFLSAGTDGEDGPTDAAGAVVDAEIGHALPQSEMRAALEGNDAYPLLDSAGALLRTGLTGTNVTDIVVALIR